MSKNKIEAYKIFCSYYIITDELLRAYSWKDSNWGLKWNDFIVKNGYV